MKFWTDAITSQEARAEKLHMYIPPSYIAEHTSDYSASRQFINTLIMAAIGPAS